MESKKEFKNLSGKSENINPKSDMPFPLSSHNCTCLLSSPPQTLLISNKPLFLYDSYRFTVAEALKIKSRDISVQVRTGYIWNMK